LRAPRLALIGGITLVIAVTPVLSSAVLAADPSVVVQPGDTLTGIGRRHAVSVRRLMELNRLRDPNRIFVGQRLRVGRDDRERGGSSRGPRASARRTVHVVTAGATLWGISQRYRVSVGAIVAANRITNPGRIYAGQRLVIPRASAPRHPGSRASRATAAAPRQATRVVHVVTRGATLWGISQRYGVSVGAIVAANRIADAGRIYAGQRLLIPRTNAQAGRRNAPAARPASRPTMSASMAYLTAQRSWVRGILVREADRFNVPRALALAVAWQESGWQQGVVSHAGAVGVMQLMPGTAEWIGETMLGRRVHIKKARGNIEAGVRLLRHYLDRYDGNLDRVLAAYYQGQRAVDTHGIYPVSRPYIASIRYIKRLFGG
jgi:N-acetylmuramoyl-L-alanine amidase